MSPIDIPLENWLCTFNEGKLTSSEYVKVHEIGTVSKDFDTKKMLKSADSQVLVCAEMIQYFNNQLNTDKLLWLEGVREDLSNLAMIYNQKTNNTMFIIILTKNDIEGFQPVEDNENPIVIHFTLRNEVFISNEKPRFMELVTKPAIAEVLSGSMVAKLQVHPKAPQLRITIIEEGEGESSDQFLIKEDQNSIYTTAILKYINKVYPDFIHEDMVSKIITIKEMQRDDITEFFISFDIFGKVFLIGVVYDEIFNTQGIVEDEDDES